MVLEVLTTIAGITGCSSFFLQTYKIVKRKSAADVSRGMYYAILPGSGIWLTYGFQIKSVPVVVTEIVAVVASISVLVACWVYRNAGEKVA